MHRISRRLRFVLAGGLVVGSALVVIVRVATSDDAPDTIPTTTEPTTPVLAYEADGFRYEYHVPTGNETLFAVRGGAPLLIDVRREHQDEAVKCRRALEQKLHVESLDDLRGRYGDTVRRLRALGYL